jgi:hypothetical protein
VLEQRHIWRAVETGMLAERRAVWLPWIRRLDRRRQVPLVEYGLGADRRALNP